MPQHLCWQILCNFSEGYMVETGRNQCLIWLLLYVTFIILKKSEKYNQLSSQKNLAKLYLNNKKKSQPNNKNPQNKPHQTRPYHATVFIRDLKGRLSDLSVSWHLGPVFLRLLKILCDINMTLQYLLPLA